MTAYTTLHMMNVVACGYLQKRTFFGTFKKRYFLLDAQPSTLYEYVTVPSFMDKTLAPKPTPPVRSSTLDFSTLNIREVHEPMNASSVSLIGGNIPRPKSPLNSAHNVLSGTTAVGNTSGAKKSYNFLQSKIKVVDGTSFINKKNSIALFIEDNSPLYLLCHSDEEHRNWLNHLQQQSQQQEIHEIHNQEENQLFGFMDSMLDSCVISDADCVILGCNTKTEQLLGFSKQELLGKNVRVLMPQSFAKLHDVYVQRYFKTGNKSLIGIPRYLMAMKKDGSQVPVYLSLSELGEGNGRAKFLAIMRDATTLKDNTSGPNLQPVHNSPIVSRKNSQNSADFSASPRADSEKSLIDGRLMEGSMGLVETAQYSNIKLQGQIEDAANAFLKLNHVITEDLLKKYQNMVVKCDVFERMNEKLENEIKLNDEYISALQKQIKLLKQTSDKANLVRILDNEEAYDSFFDYCSRQNLDWENCLLFLKAVQTYRNKFNTLSLAQETYSALYEDIKQYSKKVDEEFLFIGLNHCLPQEIYESTPELLRAAKTQLISHPTKSTLYPLESEVLAFLNSKAVRPFLTTPRGMEVLERIKK